MAPSSAVQLARWEVMWLSKDKKGQPVIIVKECDHNLPEAMRLFNLATKGKKKGVTLRCKNVGFPPPPKYIDDQIITITRGKYKGRKVKRQTDPPVYQHKMGIANVKGLWWCPYCMKMRKFEKRTGFEYEGIYTPGVGYYCPMCDIPHTNHHVQKYNPMSMRIEYGKRTRASKSKRGKRGR